MNEYRFDDEEDPGLDAESETEDDDSGSEAMEALPEPDADKVSHYSPNKRAAQVRRAIERHRERAALKALIDDSFSQLL